MAPLNAWFVIINPTSGHGSSKKKWPKINRLLKLYEFNFQYTFTKYPKHSIALVREVIEKGFTNIICVGGDGTLHNIVNGIMTQNLISSEKVKVGVIPIGTGNDWVKTHHIPKNIELAIKIIKNGTIVKQDLGKIEFKYSTKEPVFFNNLAGVGFDGYVVSKVKKLKRFGDVAYLLGTFIGLFSFRNFQSKTVLLSKEISTKTTMILIGLGKYSGSGMQLTKNPNPFDGLFDISIAKDLSKVDILKNIVNLFNGKIVDFKKVSLYKTNSLTIEINQETRPYIQADGELIGKGDIKITLIPKAFSFYC